jgi:hypothetical protein
MSEPRRRVSRVRAAPPPLPGPKPPSPHRRSDSSGRTHRRLRSVSRAATLSDADCSPHLTRRTDSTSLKPPGSKLPCCPRLPPCSRPDSPRLPLSPRATALALRPCRPSHGRRCGAPQPATPSEPCRRCGHARAAHRGRSSRH